MKGKLPSQEQRNIFRPILIEIINPAHELVLLSAQTDWKRFEDDFGNLYSNTGKPGVPIRIMAGLMMLKIIYNMGDLAVMEQWIQNPYFQYFCGESEFQWKFPCDPSDLVHFRKRVGAEGIELIGRMCEGFHKERGRLNDSKGEYAKSMDSKNDHAESGLLSRIIGLFRKTGGNACTGPKTEIHRN